MWICSRLGFFSIVRKEGAWHVRARLKPDLLELLRAANVDLSVQEWPEADYRWRVLANAEQWHLLCAALAQSVDYPNFKNQIAALPAQHNKLDAYHELWQGLCRLQNP